MYSPISLFPEDLSQIVTLLSFISVLYLSWLFGARREVIGWIGYIFLFQVIGRALMERDYGTVTQNLPPFLLALLFTQLLEPPYQRRIRELEDLLRRNEENIKKLKRESLDAQTKLEILLREKEEIEKKLEGLELSQKEIESLRNQYREVLRNLETAKRELVSYRERMERLVEANRGLLELLEEVQNSRPSLNKQEELSRLRNERRKLLKEVQQMQALLEELDRENRNLREEVAQLKEKLEELSKEKQLLELHLEKERSSTSSRREVILEYLSDIYENIEWESRALDELMDLPRTKRREFFKELHILNLTQPTDQLKPMRGVKDIFKLKPKGGRIYFTYGKNRRWLVVGILNSEDNKDKERYLREVLVKYSS
ncbi:hypothetical protein Thal_0641 [Thermocrinis albus DSM 14484]|uniref:Uncharacterized protein n=2 Tax=Thermocrinis TaxID=75905 RepID=D3SQ37_THEAH|nr:hypothetical protein Thal_0641 [Thermocrinis albus DSM 14484]